METNIQKKVDHALTHVSRTTSTDLDVVELAYESRSVSVKVFGRQDTDYAPEWELLVNDRGRWIEVDPTTEQLTAMEELLDAEVEKVLTENRREEYHPEQDYHPYNYQLNWIP